VSATDFNPLISRLAALKASREAQSKLGVKASSSLGATAGAAIRSGARVLHTPTGKEGIIIGIRTVHATVPAPAPSNTPGGDSSA